MEENFEDIENIDVSILNQNELSIEEKNPEEKNYLSLKKKLPVLVQLKRLMLRISPG